MKESTINFDYYISKYFAPILEKKLAVIVTAIIFCGFSLIISFFLKPEYTSVATILVEEPRSNMSSGINKDLSPRKADTSYVLAEAEKLKSPSFSEEVLNIVSEEIKKDLETHLSAISQLIEGFIEPLKSAFGEKTVSWMKEITGQEAEPTSEFLKKRALLTELQKRMTITTTASRAMVWISAKTIKKEMSPVLVKNFIDIWMAMNLEENKKGIRNEREYAEVQTEEAQRKLAIATKELIEFKKQYDIPAELKVAPDVTLQLNMEGLQSRLTIAKERFDLMDKIRLETRIKEGGVVSNIKVISSPMIPINPSKSMGNSIILFGTLAGLSLAMGVVLLLDFLRNYIRHEMDITNAVDIPIIGYIPKV